MNTFQFFVVSRAVSDWLGDNPENRKARAYYLICEGEATYACELRASNRAELFDVEVSGSEGSWSFDYMDGVREALRYELLAAPQTEYWTPFRTREQFLDDGYSVSRFVEIEVDEEVYEEEVRDRAWEEALEYVQANHQHCHWSGR